MYSSCLVTVTQAQVKLRPCVSCPKNIIIYYLCYCQQELNLQSVRRELIDMLDEYQVSECFICNRLRCRCSTLSSEYTSSTTMSIPSCSDSTYYHFPSGHTSSEDDIFSCAPPADSLPLPPWPCKIEPSTSGESSTSNEGKETIQSLNNWIRASMPDAKLSNTHVTFPVPGTVLEEVNYSWPPLPGSIWSKERIRETTLREQILNMEPQGDVNGSVSAFFKNFKCPNVPENALEN